MGAHGVSDRDRRLAGFLAWAALAAAGVFATVSWQASLITTVVLLADRVIARSHQVTATVGVVALCLVPVVWFAGSSVPLSPPVTRVSDNSVVHQLAGIAVWLLFLAVWFDRESDYQSLKDPTT